LGILGREEQGGRRDNMKINEISSLSNDEIVKVFKLFNMPKKEDESQLCAHGIKQWGANYINYRI